MNRRRVLALSAGVALGSLAGCSGQLADDGQPEETTQPPQPSESPSPNGPPQRPADCSVTQDLNVEWPDELTSETVAPFVENYENAYYREVVVAYEPETRFDENELSAWAGSVRQAGDGAYLVDVEGSGGVYRPDLMLGASVVEEAPDADLASIDAIEDTTLVELLRRSANNPEEPIEQQVRHGPEVDEFAATVDDLPGEGALESKGDSVTRYVDVDGSTVKLTVTVSQLHGDYWWSATYYVDETVVRRTEDEEVPAEQGELLECRLDG